MATSPLTVGEIMSRDARTVSAADSLLTAARRMHSTGVQMVPVVGDDGGCAGVLTAWAVVRALALGWDPASTRAGDAAAAQRAVAPDADVDEAMRGAGQMVPVVEEGRYVGVLTREDVAAARRLTKLAGNADAYEAAISTRDRMYAGSRGRYVMAGVVAVEKIGEALRLAGAAHPDVIVDLPCGHGRVMRVLKAVYPAARLIGCDRDRDGVDFCAATFGAEPVYSEDDPGEVRLAADADLTWVGSLLTHVPPARWAGFLALFGRSLRPGGVLVLTTLDRPERMALSGLGVPDPAQLLAEHDEAGHAFCAYAGEDAYGLTLATPEWVRGQLVQHGFEVMRHVPAGWMPPGPGQDVWMCRTG